MISTLAVTLLLVGGIGAAFLAIRLGAGYYLKRVFSHPPRSDIEISSDWIEMQRRRGKHTLFTKNKLLLKKTKDTIISFIQDPDTEYTGRPIKPEEIEADEGEPLF